MMKSLKPQRKVISKGNRSVFMETYETTVIDQSFYKTNGEELLIVKNTDHCDIILDSMKNLKLTIKTLTNFKISPDVNKIDEEWDEIELNKGACVTFQFVEDIWYILSSDGIKLE